MRGNSFPRNDDGKRFVSNILYNLILYIFTVYLDRFIPFLVLLLLSLVNKRSWEGEGVNEEQEEQWRFLSEIPF